MVSNLKHLVLIDGNNTVLRCFHAMRDLQNSLGEPIGGAYGFVHVMRKMVSLYPGSCIVVTWDDKSARRKLILPEYKENRALPPDAKKEKIEEREAIKRNLAYAQSVTKALGLPSVKVTGLEADDIIAYLTKLCGVRTSIISTDKDFYQLLNFPNVDLNRGSFGEEVTRSVLLEQTQLTPLQYRMIHTFLGDKSDGIPGIHLVGEKTVRDIAVEFADRELDMKDPLWWEWTKERLETFKGAKVKRLVDGFDILQKNFQLVDLLDTPLLSAEHERDLFEQLAQPVTFQREKLQASFHMREFDSMDAKYVTSFENARWAIETRTGQFIRPPAELSECG